MVEYCTNAVISDGKLEKFIDCDITGKSCPYQRVCTEKETVVHTDDYKECKHLKQEIVEQPKEKKISKEKNEYKVVLVASNYVVYEKDGNNLFLNGHFDVKIGDYIQV